MGTDNGRGVILGLVCAEETGVLLRLRYAELNHVQLAFVRRLVKVAAQPATAFEAGRDDDPLAS